MNYFGFVYIWRDKKNKMFYIGSHMGKLDDGYICSSLRMKRAYKKRNGDFKRRILYFLRENDKKILHINEQKWLQMIKPEEIGVKYFNLKRTANGGNLLEGFGEDKINEYKSKLRKSANRSKDHYSARPVYCDGIIYSTITDAKIALGFHPSRRLYSDAYPNFYFLDKGPPTEEAVLAESTRRKQGVENGVKARLKALLNTTKEWRLKKAAKAVATRKIKCPLIGKNISESLKKKPGRKLSIDGVIYEKARIAAEALGVKERCIRSRLRSRNFTSWFYLDDEFKNPNFDPNYPV